MRHATITATKLGLIVCALALAGVACDFGSNSQPTKGAQNINSSNAPTAQDVFERRAKCAQVKTTINDQVEAYNRSQTVQRRPQNNSEPDNAPGQTYGSYLDLKRLDIVFYSPKLNTCIDVVLSGTYLLKGGAWIPIWETYIFSDAFTGEQIDSVQTVIRGESITNDYAEKLKNYQQ